MTTVYDRILVGTADELNKLPQEQRKSIYTIYCAKIPFHQQALGYTGCCPDTGDKERDIAIRGNSAILNLLDAPETKYVNKTAMIRGLRVAIAAYAKGWTVAFICNQGVSRSPVMASLLIGHLTGRTKGWTTLKAMVKSKYKKIDPNTGVDQVGHDIYLSMV